MINIFYILIKFDRLNIILLIKICLIKLRSSLLDFGVLDIKAIINIKVFLKPEKLKKGGKNLNFAYKRPKDIVQFHDKKVN